jgi:integrase
MATRAAYEIRAAPFPAGRDMSVEKVVRKNREVVWRVRWRQHGRNRARTFSTRRDALDFDAERRRAHRAGTLTRLDAGAVSLDQYVTGTWVHAHAPQLAPKTRRDYAAFYDRYVSPALGDVQLRELTPDVIARLQADLLRLGLGHEAMRKTVHVVLKGMLTHAVQSGLILANPARAVRMARAPMREEIRPLAPETIEALRTELLQRPEQRLAFGSQTLTRAALNLRDATIVSVLAYAGLRPQELRRLRWTSVKERTIVIGAPKTGRRRSVRLLEHLADDLAAWGRAVPTGQTIFPADGGGEWTAGGFNKWRERVFLPAVRAVGLDHARPYDLRHSFASLLLHEGRSVIYVARQLGHGADLTLSTYGHTIDELDDAPRIGADEAINAARTRTNWLN